MSVKGLRGAVAVAAAGIVVAGLAGCSSSGSSAPATAPPPVVPASTPSAGSASPDSATSSAPAADMPVAALLARLQPPLGGTNWLSTANMPTADPDWIAAVQKSTDEGKPIASSLGISVNLVALVDEAAKTSDLDSLIKLCYGCDMGSAADGQAAKDALTKAMNSTDAKGRTGFAQLSILLEQSHPAPGHTTSSSWDYPGYAVLQKGAATPLDQQDYAQFGLPYTGVKVRFENVNDGSNPTDGWLGLVTSP